MYTLESVYGAVDQTSPPPTKQMTSRLRLSIVLSQP